MANADAQSVALPPIVDLDALDSVQEQLIDAIASGPVTVEAGAVERVATNALFMLLSAAETARRSSFEFSISAPSEPMTAAIDRLGLGGSFESLVKG
jgi:anti-anti-sigma regulatory factor